MERQNEASLAGKVAIVTGSSRGIGKRAAIALARRGARLVVTARTVEASGSELPGTIGQTVKEIEAAGGEAVAVAADLSNEQDPEEIVAVATDRFGGVDILVNNAAVTVGYNWSAPLLEMPRADWLHHFAVNLHAPFTLAQLTVPSMEARGGGRIINVTTGSAEAHRLVEEPNPASSIKYYSGDVSGGIIDALATRDGCDVIADFSFYYPTTIFLGLMGLPPGDLPRFMAWESSILHSHGSTPAEIEHNRMTAMAAVLDYFRSVIAERRQRPEDDLISHAIGFEVDGRPVTDAEVTSYCFFMFMAGLDTVAAALGYALYHFATHPGDRQRIVADPGLIPAAIEEILRVYAFTIPARKVKKDIEVGGCPIAAGSMVQLPIRAATRDSHAFAGGAEVRIDRTPNNHIAFGAGPHRCLGSHLARHELVIALEEWHKRIPDYRLADEAAIFEVGRSSGPDSVPLRWDR